MTGNELRPFDEGLLTGERPPVLDLHLQLYDGLECDIPLDDWKPIITGIAQHNDNIAPDYTITLGDSRVLRGRLSSSLAEYCAQTLGVHLAIEVPVVDDRELALQLGTLAMGRLQDIRGMMPSVEVRQPRDADSIFHLRVDHEGVCFWQLPGSGDEDASLVVLGNGVEDLSGTLERYSKLCTRLALSEVVAMRLSPEPSVRRHLLVAGAKQLYDAHKRTGDHHLLGYDQSPATLRPEGAERPQGPKNLHLDLTGAHNSLSVDVLRTSLGELRKIGLNTVRLRFSSAGDPLHRAVAEACQQYNLQLQLIADELELPEALVDIAHSVVIPVSTTHDPFPKKLQPYAFNLFNDAARDRIRRVDQQLRDRQSSAALTLQLAVGAHNLARLHQLPQEMELQTGLSPSSIMIELLEPQPLRLTVGDQSDGESFRSLRLEALEGVLRGSFRGVHTRHWAEEPGYQAVMNASGGLWGFDARLSNGELAPVYYGTVDCDLEQTLKNHESHLRRIRSRRSEIEAVREPLGLKTADLAIARGAGGISGLIARDALAAAFFGRAR